VPVDDTVVRPLTQARRAAHDCLVLTTDNRRELQGRAAIVTGAARNIGREIACSLASAGASVLVNARTSVEMARETVEQIRSEGGTAEVFLGDVTDPAAVDAMVADAVGRFGRLDILVNNAGTRKETPLLEMSLEEWRGVLAVVLDAAFLTTKASLPHLIASGQGAIVNLGGQTAHLPQPERAHVAAGKAGLAAFTRAVAVEFADKGVTVNCVAPYLIDTVRGLPGAPERPPGRRMPPVGHLGSMDDVASMVRHLAGPHGRYITGQTIHVNGGGYMP
jgi:3-oxoacyl-[acyl-carrier protein] reductase